MIKNKILHYDVFSSQINKGNPLGIVLDANNLNSSEMQYIAKKIGFNETVFILDSNKADLKLKYFTPGHEINLCGHATIGALYYLKTSNKLANKKIVKIETNVGLLPIFFNIENELLYITMQQDNAKFIEFNGDIKELAESIGIQENDIDTDKPIIYGNTGTWTLLIPIKELKTFKKMKADNKTFPNILKEIPNSSIHPFCMDSYNSDAFMHARHFSSPYSGTIEDPVTGTGSGVMGAYYLNYLDNKKEEITFIVEQGMEINKDGRVIVEAKKTENNINVKISGTAVFVKEIFL